MNTCEMCDYWCEIKEEESLGECRRFPPTMFLGYVQRYKDSDGCGEWSFTE